MSFEIGPIRPPSEAVSLLIRVTRNCPWNRCRFCITYKGTQFSRRPVEEIKADITEVKRISERIRKISHQLNCGGDITAAVANSALREGGESFYHVARWLYCGGETVFLQDANSLLLKTGELVEILNFLKECFPRVTRVTTYARASTIARKTVAELASLRAAGLSRIHVGMESGCDEVLAYMEKGTTAGQLVEAGRKIKAAGISPCYYVILGLGGKRWARRHPVDTAKVLAGAEPDFIRLRTMAVVPGTALYELTARGDFQPLTEDEIVSEEKVLLEHLEGVDSYLVSDHVLNLLEEVRGHLLTDREKMLNVINRYLALPDEQRLNFRLGKRAGVYRRLDDMQNRQLYDEVAVEQARLAAEGRLEETLSSLQKQFI
jgi:histone acetyltransferase (RNA polymerase elongator complex component)